MACFGLVLSSSIAYGLVDALASLPSRAATAMHSSTEGRMLARPGGRLFAAVGCAKYHVPALAGLHGEVPLYSDLLLHDMGQALDDKIRRAKPPAPTGAPRLW